MATIPIANNSLSSDAAGAVSGGGGLADSYYQPVIIGWQTGRADIRAAYGFLAPTGRFRAGATDNVGSGYWTHTLSCGGDALPHAGPGDGALGVSRSTSSTAGRKAPGPIPGRP